MVMTVVVLEQEVEKNKKKADIGRLKIDCAGTVTTVRKGFS